MTLFGLPVQQTDSDERFTPPWIFEALGEHFDLDPASPIGLATHVPANYVYTREDDGLTQPWNGFVWVNPPFSNATAWADRFIAHGNGIWLGVVANSGWFQRLVARSPVVWLMRDFPFLHPTHAGKRSAMPLAMCGLGVRAELAICRAARRIPDAGVLLACLGSDEPKEIEP